MIISDEAVEAAAKIVYRTSGMKRVMSYDEARDRCASEAQVILEAAAPHIAASAWDEGKRSADLEWQQSYDLVTPDEERFVPTNPYRSQA